MKVIVISKDTGFHNVKIIKDKNIDQGFYYKYTYIKNNNIKTLLSLDLRELELKVKKRDLDWRVTNNKLAIQTRRKNILYNFNNEIKWSDVD